MRVFLLIAALALAACAARGTPYQPVTGGYGVEAQPVKERTVRVSAHGNDETSRATINDYLLLKAAEETLRQGYAGFLFLTRQDDSAYQTAGIHLFHMPGQEAVIRLLTADELAGAAHAFDARQVWNNLAPRYVKR